MTFVPLKSFLRAHGTLRLISGHLDVWCVVASLQLYFYPDCINLQIFELIIGRFLFVPRPWPEYMLDAPTGHLWQMLCFTQEQMTREQVDSSKLGDKYFVKPNDIGNPFCLSFCFGNSCCCCITYATNTGQLRSDAPILNNPFALSLRHFQVLQEADVLSTARVMRRCLRLLQDPWWHGAA